MVSLRLLAVLHSDEFSPPWNNLMTVPYSIVQYDNRMPLIVLLLGC